MLEFCFKHTISSRPPKNKFCPLQVLHDIIGIILLVGEAKLDQQIAELLAQKKTLASNQVLSAAKTKIETALILLAELRNKKVTFNLFGLGDILKKHGDIKEDL